MVKKSKALHHIVIEGCKIATNLKYNLNTNHIGVYTSFRVKKLCKSSVKSKFLHHITIDGCRFTTVFTYNSNTKHINISTNHVWREQYYKDNRKSIRKQQNDYAEANRDPNRVRLGSEEWKIKISCAHQGIDVKDFDKFIGRAPNRKHVLPKNQCIKLNTYFEGSNMHHIMSGVVIYMPKDLHKSRWHNMKLGKNMNEINELAMNYLRGDINE